MNHLFNYWIHIKPLQILQAFLKLCSSLFTLHTCMHIIIKVHACTDTDTHTTHTSWLVVRNMITQDERSDVVADSLPCSESSSPRLAHT